MGDMISNGYKSKIIIKTIIYRRGFSVTDDENIKNKSIYWFQEDSALHAPETNSQFSRGWSCLFWVGGQGRGKELPLAPPYPTLDAGDSVACGGLQGGRRWMP